MHLAGVHQRSSQHRKELGADRMRASLGARSGRTHLQSDDTRRVGGVLLVEELQQLDLRLSLLQERFLRLDDLDGHRLATLIVVCLHHLTERALPNHCGHLVALVEQLAALHNIVIVFVVPPCKTRP